MYGWNGRFLRVNLTKQKAAVREYSAEMAKSFLGGRGFAAKILWDELKPGVDPLSPENRLVFAAGPLTGFALPSSGKLVVAAKSPLTGGYGDGNIGSHVAVQMRKAGYDAIIIEGKAEAPTVLLIQDGATEFLDAKELWGLNTFETEDNLRSIYGPTAGILEIGPAGENLVKFANIVCQKGRGGGRPGMGAVMGSKNLKAVVIIGSGDLPAAYSKDLKELGAETYREILTKPNYTFWKRQGTMMTIEWSQENSVLPTHNFNEGVFEDAEAIGGFSMEKIKSSQRGCPNCNMTCGNVVNDADRKESELDYENVAMLGSNIGVGDLKKVAALNRVADEFGLDTISLGNVIGFAMEASEKKLINEKIPWGGYKAAKALIKDIAYRKGLGEILSEGTHFAAEKFGSGSNSWAMHVKGLEISAYDCHAAPAMALAYGTSPIGAHHKDAWVISWEVKTGRERYSEEKVDKIIEFQRIRGGFFECATVCRLPWIELGFELEWYPKFLHAATGLETSWDELNRIADRVYALIRAFWVREYGKNWSRDLDYPPARWFEQPLTKGALKGAKLDKTKYEVMLNMYYKKRGWDGRGIPTKTTLEKLGLKDVAKQLKKSVRLWE
ncbi:MAG: aldehyde ferredoxin oxidoreductase family protein [Candidatus Bathyarchaeota archaeon]|jgi:aldehyde:ferredoxin oxidoreductase|nr:aldehyde ferredoxin oxidoreductase family protein [Candidatus Bathyarchaeota archaeon A05DMB-3]MDH7606487.1 aldehyde ferredoxin oxidoreductase family protein [Candidatus Bathyarchaeota archaeon]